MVVIASTEATDSTLISLSTCSRSGSTISNASRAAIDCRILLNIRSSVGLLSVTGQSGTNAQSFAWFGKPIVLPAHLGHLQLRAPCALQSPVRYACPDAEPARDMV